MRRAGIVTRLLGYQHFFRTYFDWKNAKSDATPVCRSIGPLPALRTATSAWLRKKLFVVGGGRFGRRGLIRMGLGRVDECSRRVCALGGGALRRASNPSFGIRLAFTPTPREQFVKPNVSYFLGNRRLMFGKSYGQSTLSPFSLKRLASL